MIISFETEKFWANFDLFGKRYIESVLRKIKTIPNHELQRNFFASLEIPNLGR